ncbi:LicD family-domain-containing protein [Podospora appendiculata]|uniref:LicD family-domain-containing protein n=1 Tax=Podospora appendiculata TaxID=314037 RepID=A0AAE0X4A6_9PEZI|nr:LicD family-domain-containing protein [Podospora appendiculata]
MKPVTLLPLPALVLTVGLFVTSVLSHPGNNIHATRPNPAFPPEEDKYFQEPGATEILGHYDARYYHGLVPYAEHRAVLRHLIRSYLTVTKELGIETWLAHGTLLGWWWNGRIMPWDYDLDVQVSHQTLYYLAANHNRTMHEYSVVDEATGDEQTKTYLLDINPHHGDMGRAQGQNVIDGRWIDTSNGMFIDITGLAERDPKHSPGVWSCKNFHRYRTRDLYPMRLTEFEGVEATIPYNFESVLISEYGRKSLIMTQWEGHRWDADYKEWVRIEADDHAEPLMRPGW